MGAGSGQALVALAVLLPLALLPVAAYAIDASALATRSARLQEALDQVAEDGAQQLDVSFLRTGGGVRLDPAAATATTASELATIEPAASIDSVAVAGATLTVSAHEPVQLFTGAVLRGGPVVLRSVARARLRPGFAQPAGP